jgi:hypothetical protein
MASKTIIKLEDDTDGSEAAETIHLGLDGASFEIDLSDRNATKLRKAFGPYVEKARKVGGRRSGSRRSGSTFNDVDVKAVRAWARSAGIELSSRGRVPADVIEKYRAAGN